MYTLEHNHRASPAGYVAHYASTVFAHEILRDQDLVVRGCVGVGVVSADHSEAGCGGNEMDVAAGLYTSEAW